MIRKVVIYFLFLIVLSGIKVYSQQAATVSLIGGYTFPLGFLYQKFGDSSNAIAPLTDKYYYLTYGYSYGVMFKEGIGKKRNIRITGTLNFTVMGQSKDYTHPDLVSIKLRQSFLSLGVGAEWNLAPKRTMLNPFVGGEFDINLFGGSYQQIFASTTNTYNLSSTVRGGISFGGGIDFQFHQQIGALIGVKYYMANLIGKNTTGASGTNYGLDDGTHMDPTTNIPYPSRSINVFQIYGGFSYYFGK